jgi:hypothetical protein
MKIIIIIGLSFLLGPFFFNISHAFELKSFKTDYCTGFREGTFKKPNLWKECCFEHDLRYWFGGTKKQENFADTQLKNCVYVEAGPFYSNLMYYAVRAGHYSPIKHSTHWGWGWSDKRKYYQSLNSEQKKIIAIEVYKLDLSDKYIQTFLKKYQLN